ncbi:MAG: TonB-dependent receptor [Hymenobacter sp.]|nr:TonB-dependent receptor [Hymenobacter sp.]
MLWQVAIYGQALAPPAPNAACVLALAVRVTDHKTGLPLPSATVRLLETGEVRAADAAGNCLFQLCPGSYRVEARLVGYRAETGRVQLRAGQPQRLALTLRAATQELAGVQVQGQSEATTLRQSAQAVAVLDVRPYYGQAFGLTELVNRVPGVRVRQDGGLGSEANLSLNGLGGKQVKLFLDGIPLDYYGRGLGLNVLPVNLIERLEVYRGVTPVTLGADALGGALNVVTRREQFSYADASYERSSFNTHRAGLNGRYVAPKTGFYVVGNGFYSSSDNDYRVRAEVVNERGTPEARDVPRFHDKFNSYLGRVEAGWQDRPWADRLGLSAFGAGLDRQLQHNVVMSQPYGAATYGETSAGTALTYQKAALLPGLDVTGYAGYTRIRGTFVDTTLNAYTWDGRVYTRRAAGGELSSSRNLLTLTAHTGVGSLGATYALSPNSRLVGNVLLTGFRRRGTDPVAAAYFGQDYYQNPTTLGKLAAGLAYEHDWLEGRLGSSTAMKYFGYNSRGFVVDNARYEETSQARRRLGANQLLRWQPGPQWLLKASYEYATRLPDEQELFGDGVLVRPSPALTAETSHNANLEARYTRPRWSASFGGFARHTDDVIWLRASQFFAQYQNLLAARTLGAEAEVRYTPAPVLSVALNATFQNIRNRSTPGRSGVIDDRYYNARLPNLPYLFGNAEVQLTKADLGGPGRRLRWWWQASYVHEFFLYWEVDGLRESKAIIPTQFVQNTGLSYALPADRLTLSLEAHNFLNTRAYDNFSAQRPGRSWHLKLRAFLRPRPLG